MKYLIWSIEHGGWWKPQSCGYTRLRHEAGRYSFEEATKICSDANRHEPNIPTEAMVAEEIEAAA